MIGRVIPVGVVGAAFLFAGCGGESAETTSSETPVVQMTLTYTVRSSNMEPTLHCAKPAIGCEAAVADVLLVKRFQRDPARGDIIVFKTPPAAAQKCGAGGTFVKRLIALPGETWEERSGYVYINGKRLVEPYLKGGRRDTGTYPKRTIPSGRYFSMGDNRVQSCDSREWGPVPRSNLVGRVVKIRRSS
jgi:signal peptidase I